MNDLEQETEKQLRDAVIGLHDLSTWIAGDREEDDTRALAEHYGVAEEDYYGDPDDFIGPDGEEVVNDAVRESVLCIYTEIFRSVVFGTGGPHTEIEITLSNDGEPLRGRVVGYWGGDKVERYLSSDTVDAVADYFGLAEMETACPRCMA